MLPGKLAESVAKLFQEVPAGFRDILTALILVGVIWLTVSPVYLALSDRHASRTKKLLELLKLRLEVEKAAKERGMPIDLGPYGEEMLKESWWRMIEDARPSALGRGPFENRLNATLIASAAAWTIFMGQYFLGRLFGLLPWPRPYGWLAPLCQRE